MSKPSPRSVPLKPKNLFLRPVEVDFKALFKALTKGLTHYATGKWDELASDTLETLFAFSLRAEPDGLAFTLISRAAAKAVFDVAGEAAALLVEPKQGAESLLEQMDFRVTIEGVAIDRKFFDRPDELKLINDLQVLLRLWLVAQSGEEAAATAIAARFPSYFIYALNQEWRHNLKSYQPLAAAIDTPFTQAGDRELAWASCTSASEEAGPGGLCSRRKRFGLDQIYVELNAYYEADPGMGEMPRALHKRKRTVVSLELELERWLGTRSRDDAIRVISGGPGSGKSSFARIFAARIAERGGPKCLLIPLHLIDPDKDLVDEVGQFAKTEGLTQNPLDPASPEPDLLIIFDGLDELATQGKATAETARAFLRHLDLTVDKCNRQSVRLRVLVSGRELIVQENETEFRRPQQILNLLPYLVESGRGSEEYVDPQGLLKNDLRQQWWKQYGVLGERELRRSPSSSCSAKT